MQDKFVAVSKVFFNRRARKGLRRGRRVEYRFIVLCALCVISLLRQLADAVNGFRLQPLPRLIIYVKTENYLPDEHGCQNIIITEKLIKF
jgi:hypothetical protein